MGPSGPLILVGKQLPEINAGIQDLQVITDLAWRAVMRANDPEYLFQHGGHLTRIETLEDGTKRIRALGVTSLRHEIARVAAWYRIIDDDGTREDSKPPIDVGAGYVGNTEPTCSSARSPHRGSSVRARRFPATDTGISGQLEKPIMRLSRDFTFSM
jgi:hypothetical protein